MTHYAQPQSEINQNYLNWRDWPRALDVLEVVSAPNGGGFYCGKMLAGSIYAHGGTVFVEKIEVLRSKIADFQRILGALIVSETVTIPAVVVVQEPEWLANLRDPSLSKKTGALDVTVRSILNSVVNPDTHAEIRRQLVSVDVSKAAPSHLVAVLSSLFTWREVMPEWKVLRDDAYRYYSKQNLKGVERAFKGMM